MCRLYALLANGPTKVECGLIRAQHALLHQALRDPPGHQHVHGWGIVCYDPLERSRIPTTVHHAGGALDVDRFDRLAKTASSKAIVAHVRHATVGGPSTLNAHPFTFDEWTFAHQGTIPNFHRVRRTLEANTCARQLNCRLGTSDSELLFLWLICQLEAQGIDGTNVEEKHERARRVMAGAIAQLVEGIGPAASEPILNFVLTNGHVLFACRWNHEMVWTRRDGVVDCEFCGVPHAEHGPAADHRAIAVASAPITSEVWDEVPDHSLMYVGPDLTCVVDAIPGPSLVAK